MQPSSTPNTSAVPESRPGDTPPVPPHLPVSKPPAEDGHDPVPQSETSVAPKQSATVHRSTAKRPGSGIVAATILVMCVLSTLAIMVYIQSNG